MRRSQPVLTEVLTRRKFGRTNFLAEFLGGNYTNRRHDIYALEKQGLLRAHRPGGDGKIERAYADHWHYIWSLASRKLDLDWHEVGVDDIMLAVEIWAKKSSVTFQDAKHILKGKHLELPCEIKWDFPATRWRKAHPETYDKPVCPDALFSLGERYFALEFDRDSESIYPSTFKDTKSWHRSLLQYGHVLKNRTYQKEWNIPSLTLLVVCTATMHTINIAAHLRDVIGADSPNICFNAVPVLADTFKSPTPALPLFDDWTRVGFPNFNMAMEVMNGRQAGENTRTHQPKGGDRTRTK